MRGWNPDIKLHAGRGPSGRHLCRWCGTETKPPRRTWCSKGCVDAYLEATNWPALRAKVFKRDKGVCNICSLDTVDVRKALDTLKSQDLRILESHLGVRAIYRRRIDLWDADHIVAISEGGKEFDIENIRTLCVWCHKRETAKLRGRLSDSRREQRYLPLLPS